MWVLGQRGPKTAVDAGAHAGETRVGDGGEAELGGGAADLLKMRGEERFPRGGGGRCSVGGRHGMVEEVGEAGCGGADCQTVFLCPQRRTICLSCFTLKMGLACRSWILQRTIRHEVRLDTM
jgi:hypothetical protein